MDLYLALGKTILGCKNLMIWLNSRFKKDYFKDTEIRPKDILAVIRGGGEHVGPGRLPPQDSHGLPRHRPGRRV